MRSGWAVTIATLALVLAGCDEDETITTTPEPAVKILSLSAFPDSVRIGGTVDLEVEAAGDDLAYQWTATAGTFLDDAGPAAVWKAPDEAAIVRVSAVVSNPDATASASVMIAVATYLPRDVPFYLGSATCGECHFADDEFRQWQGSAHALAWDALGEETGNQDCYRCHTVGYGDTGETGESLDNGGYDEIAIGKLTAVQCESCHGPLGDPEGLSGLVNHDELREGPDLMGMGTDGAPEGCGNCHARFHNPYEAEWRASGHAVSHLAEGAAEDPACTPCHTAGGFVDAFVRATGAQTYGEDTLPATCVTCHDPHDPTHPGMLREAADLVCLTCHAADDPLAENRPHHPQLDVLSASGAVAYDGYTYASSPHRDETPNRCTSCHVTREPYAGPGEPAYTHHDLAPRPENCVACHPSAQGAPSLDELDFLAAARATVDSLSAVLEAELEAAPSDTTQAYRDALYNLELFRADGSRGAHNFLYVKSVLEATIESFDPVPGRLAGGD